MSDIKMNGNENRDVKILVVEDSITQGEKLQHILEEAGYKIIRAMTASKALEYLENETPSIIITDIVMPEMNGFQFCTRVKRHDRWKSIPVIILTSLSEPYDILQGLESGADNFITKPYEKEYLLSRVQYLLQNLKLRGTADKHNTELEIEIYFSGKKHHISYERMQIIDLLFSTFEAILQKNRELERLNRELRIAGERIKTLTGLIPICSKCKKVRNDDGYWQEVEEYVAAATDADFTHGICNDCMKALYPDFYEKMQKRREVP